MRLSRTAIIILTIGSFLALLIPIRLLVNLLFPNEHSILNILTWLFSLVMLAIGFRFLSKRWPEVFSDGALKRGPKLTLSRIAGVVIFITLWTGSLIWMTASAQIRYLQALIIFAIWFAFLVFIINHFEGKWLHADANINRREENEAV